MDREEFTVSYLIFFSFKRGEEKMNEGREGMEDNNEEEEGEAGEGEDT